MQIMHPSQYRIDRIRARAGGLDFCAPRITANAIAAPLVVGTKGTSSFFSFVSGRTGGLLCDPGVNTASADMASHGEDDKTRNKSVELDLSSVSTIDISSDTEDRLLNNTTVTISDDEGNFVSSVSDSQVGDFSWSKPPIPELYNFKGQSPNKANGFHLLETPTKRPHSPEIVSPDSVKRKYDFDVSSGTDDDGSQG